MKLISKVFFGLFFLTLNFSSVTAHSSTSEGYHQQNTQIDSDSLPVGMLLVSQNDKIIAFYFRQLTPNEILAGETNYDTVDTGAGKDDPLHNLYVAFDFLELDCNAGRVLTGMKLKTDDAEWPYNGKVITGMSIRCTELSE